MRVLILSNMYPSRQKPYAGIFVRNQVEILRDQHGTDLQTTVKAMRRRYTGRIGSVLKYILFTIRCLPHFFRHYDVVHVHYLVPLGILGAAYRALHPASRLVVTFHGGDVNSQHFRGLPGKLWRVASNKIDLGIAVGPGVAEAVDKNLNIDTCRISPAGVDSRKFFPPDKTSPEKQYDFLFAGSYLEAKGVDLLVEALRDERLTGIRAGFVGTGPMRKLIESLGDYREIVIFDYMTQDELRQVFWESRFLVLPSRSEAFGLVVSEAMFCGVPAIVSDEPGPASQVSHRENGFVFTSGSVESLVETLVTAVQLGNEEYADMAAQARSCNREFDLIEVTRELVNEYHSLVDSRESADG